MPRALKSGTIHPNMADDDKPIPQEPEEEAKRCTEEMYDGNPCGRPIHNAPPAVDEQPVCLMHSRDPGKNDEEFQAEFERILHEAGDGVADFTKFVFPSARYAHREFKAKCVFRGATFTQDADFSGATFRRGANFVNAWFVQNADFGGATFRQDADFSTAVFMGGAYFGAANLTEGDKLFPATFTQDADFSWAFFDQDADFNGARFSGEAQFEEAGFEESAIFSLATFQEGAQFRKASFNKNEKDEPTLFFNVARFEKPHAVTFYRNYLGQALFHNCDVSEVVFSDVRWRRRGSNRKRMLFEELPNLDIEKPWAVDLRAPEGSADERNYGLIAETYQQLKKNYDDRRDYWTAGDFHYGEMEMKRLSSRRKNRVVRWLHRYLGLAAWYKYASQYGESHVRPAVLLLIFLLVLFPAIYPLIGLRPSPAAGSLPAAAQTLQSSQPTIFSYASYFRGRTRHEGAHRLTILQLLADGEITSVDAALLRHNLEYQPIGGWGWLAMRIEFALAATLFALFLLALRRQFRR